MWWEHEGVGGWGGGLFKISWGEGVGDLSQYMGGGGIMGRLKGGRTSQMTWQFLNTLELFST